MIRVYRTKQIGTGTYLDPYRSILHNFIDITQGDKFDEIDMPTNRFSICILNARQSVHDAIVTYKAANPGTITYLSTLQNDISGLRTQYSQLWSSLPLSFRTTAENVLGLDGLADYSGTIKDVFKRLILKYFQSQRQVSGDVNPLPTTFIFGGDNW